MAVGGEVIAAIGRRVDPLDVIARAQPPKETRAIPLGRVMGLREQDIPKHLLKHVGDALEPRDIIIRKRINVFNEHLIYRAPAAGRIVALQGSWMLLELDVAPVELLALYRGVVVNVVPRLGVTIECEGAWVQGIWGSGREGYGVLQVIAKEPHEGLPPDRVDMAMRGLVIVAGTVEKQETLQALANANAAGLVVGSLPPELMPEAIRLGLPVLITEGAGRAGLCAPIYDLLREHNGNEIVVNAAFEPGAGTARPELFIPQVRGTGQPQVQTPAPLETRVGAPVRITGEPWFGAVGTVAAVPERGQVLETGARLPGALVDLPSGRVFVPWANLELIG